MVSPRALVLSGDGINCERETAFAFEHNQAKVDIRSINQLKNNLDDYQIIALPGGFSFGDELGSGKLFSLKIKYQLGELLTQIKQQDKLVIGICNGFQTLVKLGLLPFPEQERKVTLAYNQNLDHTIKPFTNIWTALKAEKSCCIWTKDLDPQFSLPVRHGEGRIVLKPGEEESIYMKLRLNKQIALTYEQNINGSYQNIAGLCDPTGKIFGLMPHPEAALFNQLRPAEQSIGNYIGNKFFKNAVEYFQ